MDTKNNLSDAATAANGDDSANRKYPAVPMYGPCNVRDLKPGTVKYWCACGLSRKQPWCDGSHKGTGIKPIRWVVPESQILYQICNCKYTNNPPYCDATHIYLPTEVLDRKATCKNKSFHTDTCKLCTQCGWVPDF